jgi:uncharacterized membrane protein
VKRHVSARLRVNLSASVGLAAGGVAAVFAPWQMAALIGWDVAVLVKLTWALASIHGLDAADTRSMSTVEDDSRTTATVVVVTACVVSLLGSVLGLVKAKQGSTAMEAALTSLALLTVVLSWSMVHVMLALRYAHLYYTEPVGGVEFGPEEPDYRDFVYLAFTVGMSFAVSDTDVRSQRVRRTVTRHALTSYLFGTAIIGLTINVMAGFI